MGKLHGLRQPCRHTPQHLLPVPRLPTIVPMAMRYAILRAPLVPVAVLATVGVLIDRTTTVGWTMWSAVIAMGFGVWFIAQRRELLAVLGLAVGMTGLAAL